LPGLLDILGFGIKPMDKKAVIHFKSFGQHSVAAIDMDDEPSLYPSFTKNAHRPVGRVSFLALGAALRETGKENPEDGNSHSKKSNKEGTSFH
jgi:hypothetical protein